MKINLKAAEGLLLTYLLLFYYKIWDVFNRCFFCIIRLVEKNIKFINREKGSGVRVLLDEKLRLLNIDPNSINGYYNEENSHLAVASTVGRGDANVGLGNKKASMQVETIDFIPLQTERYDLIIKKSDLNNPIYKSIISILSSEKFKNELQGIGGYDLKDLGKIISTT